MLWCMSASNNIKSIFHHLPIIKESSIICKGTMYEKNLGKNIPIIVNWNLNVSK